MFLTLKTVPTTRSHKNTNRPIHKPVEPSLPHIEQSRRGAATMKRLRWYPSMRRGNDSGMLCVNAIVSLFVTS